MEREFQKAIDRNRERLADQRERIKHEAELARSSVAKAYITSYRSTL
jgi:hypothetical protein